MPKRIIWSPLAEADFSNILKYLDQEWNDRVVIQFMDIAFRFLEQIAINPKQFPLIYKREKIRKCVLTKHNVLYYREGKENIDILRIYDTRQDPRKLKFK